MIYEIVQTTSDVGKAIYENKTIFRNDCWSLSWISNLDKINDKDEISRWLQHICFIYFTSG